MADARKEGLEEGLEEGLKKGMMIGQLRATRFTARNMLRAHYPLGDILEVTGIGKKTLDRLLQEERESPAVPG